MELTACRFLKAPQSTEPKKPQRGGPVAQDQTSTQRAKPHGGRRARRPGPDVHPTQEASGREKGQTPRTSRPPNQRTEASQTPRTSRPPNQRTARPVASGRATVRTVHFPLHRTTTSQSLVWDRSLAVVGFRGSGRRWWSTSGNGKGRLSQDTSG